MNALFGPNSGKRNATWIGELGVVIGNRLQLSNATEITINATSKSICIGEGLLLRGSTLKYFGKVWAVLARILMAL